MCSSEASSDKEKGLRRQLDETGVCRAGEAIVFADTEEDLMRGRAGALSSRSRSNFGGGREDGDERVSGGAHLASSSASAFGGCGVGGTCYTSHSDE